MPYSYEGRIVTLNAETNLGLFAALITSPSTPTEATGWSSMAEATFPGYSRSALTFPGASLDAGNYAKAISNGPHTFTRSTDGVVQNITAVVCIAIISGSPKVVDYAIFSPAIPIEFAGDEIKLEKWTLFQGSPVPIL